MARTQHHQQHEAGGPDEIDLTGLSGAGGAPDTADYLVGTAQGGLSAEIVVGTTPGGELGGTWASPTVDATHSGSTHSAATDAHIADTTDAHDASAVSFDDTGLGITATEVQTAIEQLDAAIAAGGIPATIVDAKGDLIAATAADTVARLAVGANDTILMADSSQTTGLKWVASQTPSTQAFSDAAAEGTADTYARGDHKHGMPASSSVGNLWKMSNAGTSQTLGTGATQITFDSNDIDGGSSVIDLANDRFVAPATGFYMAFATWLWEATAPAASANMSARVGGTDAASLCRLPDGGTPGANSGMNGSWPLSLTSGDFVTLYINPNGTTPTARGNASVHLRTSFTLVRIT